jgi:hypothetical protein
MEAILECTRLMPVVCANVTAGIGRDTTADIYDCEEDEANASEDLDDPKDEFDCTQLAC